jgi:3-oxoadipate enol-lactonase
MPFAQSPGARIHYSIEGDGPETLLLIMGLGGHATEWGTDFPADLARRFRVVRMDNRGIAQSEALSAPFTLEDMARDAVAVLDALGVERAHVAGTSMGGMIAQTVALDHAPRVSRLVLMSTSHGGQDAVPPWEAALALFSPIPGETLAEQRRRSLGVITGPGFAQQNPALIEHLVEQRVRIPTSGRTFMTQLDAILKSDRSARVAKITSPTLVIHGDQDSLVPVGNGQLLAAKIPSARLALLPGCGHLPHLERPADCAALVADFLV